MEHVVLSDVVRTKGEKTLDNILHDSLEPLLDNDEEMRLEFRRKPLQSNLNHNTTQSTMAGSEKISKRTKITAQSPVKSPLVSQELLASQGLKVEKEDLFAESAKFFASLSSDEIKAKTISHPSEVQIVLYHHPCLDGTGAAVAAVRYFGHHTRRVKCIPCSRLDFENIIHKVKDKNVLVTDFSFSLPELQRLYETCAKLKVIDHHRVNLPTLSRLPNSFVTFNETESGASLTHRFFFGDDTPLPPVFEVLKQNDLFSFQDVRHFAAGLGIRSFNREVDTFTTIAELSKEGEEGVQKLVDTGTNVWNNYHRIQCEIAIKNAKLYQFLNTSYKFLYYEHDGSNSIVGNFLALLPEADFVVLRRISSPGNESTTTTPESLTPFGNISTHTTTYFTLRSSSDKLVNGRFHRLHSQVNVSALAQMVDPNGGGHSGAATMRISTKKLFRTPLERTASNKQLALFQLQ